MITDLIVTWPRNCDYPLWRQFIRDNRTRFNEVIISFMETNQGEDYRLELTEMMRNDYVLTIQPPLIIAGEDWRNASINSALLHSYNAPWVWFTEQDFFPKDGFWEEVQRMQDEGCNVIAVYQGDRMHPCCIFMKREILNKTHKNFGIIPDMADHFSLIQKDLESIDDSIIGVISPKLYTHMNGLSHNWSLLVSGQMPNHNPDQFFDYLMSCSRLNIPIPEHWWNVASAGIERSYYKE